MTQLLNLTKLMKINDNKYKMILNFINNTITNMHITYRAKINNIHKRFKNKNKIKTI